VIKAWTVVHFTTVHPRGDTRIRVKETASLAEGIGAGVALYVQDGKGAERDEVSGVEVVDTGPPPRGRARRMVLGAWRMYRAVRAAQPRVAHFHDPELIPVGLALKLSGIKVVYDVHEDVPRQILGKHWISPWLRRPVAWAAEAFEWLAGRAFDGMVAATPTIARRFPEHKTVTVQNFPILAVLSGAGPGAVRAASAALRLCRWDHGHTRFTRDGGGQRASGVSRLGCLSAISRTMTAIHTKIAPSACESGLGREVADYEV